MTYILWALLNISSSLLFLYLIYRVTKFLYSRFGLITAILTVVVIMSVLTPATKIKADKNPIWDFQTGTDVRYFQKHYTVSLNKNAVFNIELYMTSLSDKDRQKEEPLKAFSAITGIVGYNEWTPKNISISKSAGNFEYKVTGLLGWKLLGFTVYSQQESYVGTIKKS